MTRRNPRSLPARALGLAVVVPTLVGLALPAASTATAAAAGASAPSSSSATYTPGAAQLATITNGTSAAPWNEAQGDPAYAGYTSQAPGTLLPTYTPGGATTGSGSTAEPNVAVYPGATSGTDGNSPYPSGTVGTPGPLDGYCGTGNQAQESTQSPARQPAGTTLPLAPAYFPHIVRNSDGSLTGYFDYRPKDADEAIVAGLSTDNGQSWTYEGEALEQNPGYCPSADINDDGEGHPNVVTVGGVSRLYTLQRAAGDNQGIGMLVHTLSPTASNPLGGVPASEQIGIDPDAFATAGTTVPASGGSPATIPVSQIGTAGSPEQLLAGKFVDLTATPTPVASSIITCTSVTSSPATLTGCTSAGAPITVTTNDLVEQVIGTVSTAGTIPAGPNTTTGDGGVASISVAFASQVTAAVFNNNAPNRAYADGVPVYCAQANANPTTKIENCTTGPGGKSLPVAVGDPITSDPIIPATATMTTGLVAPDGIVGVLPSYPGAPANSTIVAYTEKILNYYVAGITSNAATVKFGAASTIAFTPSVNESADMPATVSASSPVTVYLGDITASTIVPVTCTGLTTGATDSLTGCTNNAPPNDLYNTTSLVGAPGATTVPAATLAQTGEGAGVGASAKNVAKLLKNNEDLTVLRAAYTTDGTDFSSVGLANNGIISGGNTATSGYNDINNPSSTVSPANLNAYATPGTADAIEMRFVGSAGTIITNPDGSYGMWLSGAWAADGDSDAFNQIFYTSSTDGEHWSVPVSVVSTDYTFSASAAQDAALNQGVDAPLGISAYYSGRAYGPSVVQNPDGTLTMVFAGYRIPKTISPAGTVLGTNPNALYTIGATDPALYRNILVLTLSSSSSPLVATTTTIGASTTTPVVGQPVTYTATVAPVAPGTGTPTGTVSLTGSSGPLCSASLDGASPDQATCTVTYGSPATDAVNASYGGDANYATSSTTSAASVSVSQDQTTTALEVGPEQPVVGQSVTFSATVAAQAPGTDIPTGNVAITGASGTAICTATLDGLSPDTATCSAPYPAVGSDSVTATYGGDTNDARSSSSPPAAVDIGEASTTTSVASSDQSPVVGEIITLTATVGATLPGAGTPSGTVTMQGSSGPLCSGTLDLASPDQARCTYAYQGIGTDSITAGYATDGNFASSTSQSIPESIGMDQTSTAISADPTNPVVGQPVTYTATVTVSAPGSGSPTGTVTFADATNTLCAAADLDTSGVATCTTTYTAKQAASVTAAYNGDTNDAPSTSPSLDQTVTPAATSTALAVDDASPVVGQSVTYTATVSVTAPGSGTPTGTVDFVNAEGTTLCSQAIDGNDQATCATAYPAVGSDAVTATYEGDENDQSSTSSSAPVTISAAGTTTAVSPGDPAPVVGQTVTYTATVSVNSPGGGTPTGTVTFTDADGNVVCAPVLQGQQATCSTSYAHAGPGSLTASYSGDTNYSGSSATSAPVGVTAAPTMTTLAANTSSSVVGDQVTFTATVDVPTPGAGTPTGQITFADPGRTLCVTSLTGSSPDQATCEANFAEIGKKPVKATYDGDSDYQTSRSAVLTETVGASTTTTTVSSSANPAVTGQGVTFRASVSLAAGPAASGKVLFTILDGRGDSLGCANSNKATLESGVATCTLKPPAVTAGSSPLYVQASYQGTASEQASSDSLDQTVDPDPTKMTLSASPAKVKPTTQVVTFSATVKSTGPGSGTPSGTIAFATPSGPLACTTTGASVTVSKGNAKCQVPAGAVSLPVTATYSGSGAYATSSASTEEG